MDRRFSRRGKLSGTEVAALYQSGKSCSEIAEIDGTSRTGILLYLQRHDIPRRPMGAHPDKVWTKHGYCKIAAKHGIATKTYIRLLAIVQLGRKCVSCSEIDIRVLEINHRNGKSNPIRISELLELLSGERTDLEVRCGNCNIRYEFELGHRNIPKSVLEELKCIE